MCSFLVSGNNKFIKRKIVGHGSRPECTRHYHTTSCLIILYLKHEVLTCFGYTDGMKAGVEFWRVQIVSLVEGLSLASKGECIG